MKTLLFSLTLISFFSYSQNNKANALLFGVSGNSNIYFGENHHNQEVGANIGYGFSTRLPIKQFSIGLALQSASTQLKETTLLLINSNRVKDRLLLVNLGYNLFRNVDLFEPRISFGRFTSRYTKDFLTRQNVIGLGLKYARCLSKAGIFASVSTDIFWNISKNINTPQQWIQYFNNKRFLSLSIGLEYRFRNNSY